MSQDPYKLVIEPNSGMPIVVDAKTKAGAAIVIPGLQTSPDVKSFKVYGKNSQVYPDHFGMSAEFFTKWRG